MSDFLKMKNSRAAEIAKLTSQIEKLSTGGESKKGDERFWSPTVDKTGKGSAVIRFLPAPKGEDLPFIRYWDHGFKGPSGLWYIENSLSSIGQEDPVSEMNRKLWNQGEGSEGRKIVSGQGNDMPGSKRRLHYVANIYVVKDTSGDPANNGKVFLYKFGAKIFEKLNAAMHPEFENEVAINPFDFWDGANFNLNIGKVAGYRNYDKSAFAATSPILVDKKGKADDEAIEAIWDAQYALAPIIAESNFKSYAELKAKLTRVMEGSEEATGSSSRHEEEEPRKLRTAPAKTRFAEPESEEDDEVEDTDTKSLFKQLAEED